MITALKFPAPSFGLDCHDPNNADDSEVATVATDDVILMRLAGGGDGPEWFILASWPCPMYKCVQVCANVRKERMSGRHVYSDIESTREFIYQAMKQQEYIPHALNLSTELAIYTQQNPTATVMQMDRMVLEQGQRLEELIQRDET